MAQTNVLVVEDESIVSKDIQHSLKRLGYNVIGAAATGEMAVELALERTPDIILMDIMLKGEMNGIEAAGKIREETNIPVIFLTAYADESTLNKAKVTQPYGYIIKPFKEIDIHTSIEMALYKHKKETEVLKERDLLFSLVENKESGQRHHVRQEQLPAGQATLERHLLCGGAEGLCRHQRVEHEVYGAQYHEGYRGQATLGRVHSGAPILHCASG